MKLDILFYIEYKYFLLFKHQSDSECISKLLLRTFLTPYCNKTVTCNPLTTCETREKTFVLVKC